MSLSYTQQDIDNGLVLPDSDLGKELGLISERFYEGSYLWLKNGILSISMLMSKKEHCGYVYGILLLARSRGYHMCACPVSRRMEDILKKFGFRNAPEGMMNYFNEL